VFQNWVPEPGDPWHRGWQYPYTADRVTDCWEFRYDTGRERYLVRQWDVKLGSPNNLNPAAWTPNPALWTDYLGEPPSNATRSVPPLKSSGQRCEILTTGNERNHEPGTRAR
jgi:hypothetical protein